MIPDRVTAAIKATETLLKYHITTAPVEPLPIIKRIKGVIVLSFAEMAEGMGIERSSVVGAFTRENHDAVTAVTITDGKVRYCIAYNQRLPFYMLQRALARELGHIVLGHDGSRPEDVRTEEAVCFARHLLCPRPLIASLRDAGVPLTTEVIGNITGCYERCIAGIRKEPGACVPAELNRAVRNQFAEYVENFLDCHALFAPSDESRIADLGTYMENYVD